MTIVDAGSIQPDGLQGTIFHQPAGGRWVEPWKMKLGNSFRATLVSAQILFFVWIVFSKTRPQQDDCPDCPKKGDGKQLPPPDVPSAKDVGMR